jgi:hypothetical protein
MQQAKRWLRARLGRTRASGYAERGLVIESTAQKALRNSFPVSMPAASLKKTITLGESRATASLRPGGQSR